MPYYNKDPEGDHDFDNHPYPTYADLARRVLGPEMKKAAKVSVSRVE